MIIRLLRHARSNAIAYVALALSTLGLAGGAYAALAVPPNSVGALQLQNHSITPVKLNPHYIGGSIAHWARVDAQGHIIGSSKGAHERGGPFFGPLLNYVIAWSTTIPGRCAEVATPQTPISSSPFNPLPGYADIQLIRRPNDTGIMVKTYGPQGQPTPMGFSVAVVC